MALIHIQVTEGPRAGFKAVGVESVEGIEWLVMEERFLVERAGEYSLPITVIGKDREHDTFLIQLPVETDSGARRVWISSEHLVNDPDEVPA